MPTLNQFKKWIKAALDIPSKKIQNAEITVRIVDEVESAYLNQTYRHRKGPTNILSFTYHPPKEANIDLMGDLVICAAIVLNEAKTQHKPVEAHWAHLTIHGSLHLLGFDHVKKQETQKMENLEIQILNKLGFDNPYVLTVI